MKKHAIVTACNQRHESFLANNWYQSLVDNVNLADIDIVILDFGLSDWVKKAMPTASFLLCKSKGHIVNARYKELLRVVDKGYDQILMCDGGDIIFQDDISALFAENASSFRCVVEGSGSIRYDRAVVGRLASKYKKDVVKTIANKNLINVGFIIAPAERFKWLCSSMLEMLPSLDVWGFDTMIINYLLYKEGFVELPHKNNFIITNYWNEGVKVVHDVFLSTSGEVIPVVHNAGGWRVLRPVLGFGYKKGVNKLSVTYYLAKPFTRVANIILRLVR
ncbi:hypothetical protein KC614_01700 [candidate division WWE3 bacterium]|uniref:Uncharacterized protein n=1 Tax=candidate division WWE3 bacterium TaxID=2053526 RepID=A0A955RRU4_UNCKA|nr:hypothetical protein [candidate division WWE3 bacterium]